MGVSYSVGHPTTEASRCKPIQVYPASELIASGHPSGVGQTPQCRTTSDFGLLFGTCLVPFSIFFKRYFLSCAFIVEIVGNIFALFWPLG